MCGANEARLKRFTESEDHRERGQPGTTGEERRQVASVESQIVPVQVRLAGSSVQREPRLESLPLVAACQAPAKWSRYESRSLHQHYAAKKLTLIASLLVNAPPSAADANALDAQSGASKRILTLTLLPFGKCPRVQADGAPRQADAEGFVRSAGRLSS